jgi:hypothetical protein
MKKQNWIRLLLIVCCLGVLIGYRTLDQMRTDHNAPEITISEQLLEISALEPRSALLQGISAQDDVDGDVTASLVVESVQLVDGNGTAAVTYAAFDQAGNVAKEQRRILYNDYVRPRYSLNQPLLFTHSNPDLLDVVSARDILDGDISHRIRATALDKVDSNYNGFYNVRFQVTNSLGDMVELVLPVEIYSPGLFDARMTLSDYLIYLKQGDSFNARNYLDTFIQGREEFSLAQGVPDELSLTISGKVDTGVPGMYEINYRITYSPNPGLPSQIYTAYSKLIVIVEG